MILAKGKLFESTEQDRILASLEDEINETLSNKSLSAETVTKALDSLSQKILLGVFDADIKNLDIDGAEKYAAQAAFLLKRENIEFKLRTELGDNFFSQKKTNPPFDQKSIFIRPMPLGTILHIAAGNVDGLPAFSVAEGLLTGNINILKLPQADNGFSLKIIAKLIEEEPQIADFIYVFDTPSSDIAAIKKMSEVSDGIVVWGGDAAIAAVRQLAPINAKIIEWGHKLGFIYISGYEDKNKELSTLAHHIMSTKQLLCSSCQTIFVDTDNLNDIYDFCRDFLPVLEEIAKEYPFGSIGAAAEISLRKYNASIEKILSDKVNKENKTFEGERCSLTACTDSSLELSDMFGSVLVKRLSQNRLFAELRRHKGYLQTSGLICSADKREYLTDILARSGVVRITRAGSMSAAFCGEAHDGEYPLRRYTRIVNIE